MNNIDSLKFFLPELVLAGGVLFIILFNIVTSVKKAIPYFVLWVLAVAFFISFQLLTVGDGSLFEGLISINGFTVFFKLLFILGTFFTVLFSISRPEAHHSVEYYSLLLITTLGLFLLSSANDLLMVYLGLETVSICSYLLVASQKGIRKSSEAGLKYVIYGAIASGIMLYGMSILYGLYGTTSLSLLFDKITAEHYQMVLSLALFMVLVGLGYKIAAVPFHMWCPDVYEGAPTEITAFLSVAPKAAGFAIMIRFFYDLFAPILYVSPDATISQWLTHSLSSSVYFVNIWQFILAVISVLTMTIGNLAALHQTNLKRLLAYSSIAHAGYILMGLVLLTSDGMQAMVLYLPIYLFMNMGAFFAVYIIERQTGSVEIAQYEGLGWRLPFLGVVLSIFLFSLVGLPPFGGFIAKLYLFAAVINAKWYLLAVIGVLNGVFSLYYYTRIVRAMWLKLPTEEIRNSQSEIRNHNWFDTLLLLIFVIPVIILGIYWTPLLQVINKALNI